MLRVSKIWHYAFQKQASITFKMKDADRISQPKTLTQICWDIQEQIGDTYPRQWILNGSLDNTITPDAPQWDQLKGNINWYVPPGVTPQEVYPFISDVIKDAALMGIRINANPIRQESRMMGEHAYKIVLSVADNETSELEKLPEINLSNENAAAILKILAMSDSSQEESPFGPMSMIETPTGQIPAQDLLRKIKQAYGKINSAARPEQEGTLGPQPEKEEENPYAIETPYSQVEKEQENMLDKLTNLLPFPEEDQPPSSLQGRWMDQGMDKEKVWRILNSIETLALKAMNIQMNKNKPAMIVWY